MSKKTKECNLQKLMYLVTMKRYDGSIPDYLEKYFEDYKDALNYFERYMFEPNEYIRLQTIRVNVGIVTNVPEEF